MCECKHGYWCGCSINAGVGTGVIVGEGADCINMIEVHGLTAL